MKEVQITIDGLNYTVPPGHYTLTELAAKAKIEPPPEDPEAPTTIEPVPLGLMEVFSTKSTEIKGGEIFVSVPGDVLKVPAQPLPPHPHPVEHMEIMTTKLPNAKVGDAYNAAIMVAGGQGPFTITLARLGGSLPTGLSLDTHSGVITGTPTQPGTVPFAVEASDSLGSKAPRKDLVIVVIP
jgi:hypothetical protein